MLYILYGADDFSLKTRLQELEREVDDAGSLEFNLTTFSARDLTPAQLVNACSTSPFLGQKRMVVVEGLLSHFDPRSIGGGDSPRRTLGEWEFLKGFVEGMPQSTILILIDGNIRKDNLMLKKLSSKALVENFHPLWGRELQGWIMRRVRERGGNIAPRAVELLSALAGDNLWVLSQEIDKLLAYTDGRRIEAEDVRKLTNYVREVTIFATVDAIVEHRGTTAIQMIHRLLGEGVSVPYLLTMLTRQLRLMLQIKEMDIPSMEEGAIRRELGVAPKYPLNKLFRQTASYSAERLVEVYEELLKVDITIKTGRWGAELAIDLLVINLCAEGGDRTRTPV